MEKVIRTLGVTVNENKQAAAEVCERLERAVRDLGLALVVREDERAPIPSARRVPPEDLAASIDAMLALGGDGTLLQAVRLLGDNPPPLMGVNLGSLGFLTSVSEDRLEEALRALRDGDMEESRRTMAQCEVHRGGVVHGPRRALNDVVIGWGTDSRVATIGITIDGRDVGETVCDGVILSTPTGSTGHSLSAGGPIVVPDLPVFLLNVICPHTLSHRPMVIADDVTVDLTVRGASKELLLAVDGQDVARLGEGDFITVHRAARGITLLNPRGHCHFRLVRQKLHWRGSSA
jgi:NAD+ kinase